MAKTDPTKPGVASTVNNEAVLAVVAPPINADPVTPENTPVPGGGSWHWDDALPGWVENAPYAPPAPINQPIQE